ncbi:hypothetical protein C1I64_10655 [Rathayibacter festucae DSM 15932]|uniref:Uncharacterized protein n=1 Tax=Rathayibacter festucae DSM 15932 TaxID=1328866 RepID=A0A3Q9UYY9_9MICO|nr:hypothetical protein C1I64_10655 [Rathayibacter festucae DSM 15932]
MVGDDQRGDLSVALRERLGGSALSGQGGSGGRWISMRPLRGLLDQHEGGASRLDATRRRRHRRMPVE